MKILPALTPNFTGCTNGFGWGWPKDVAGALEFLRERPDVDPERIGGLGLSRGADVLIQVAAEDRDLKAVVADGATGGSFADYRNLGEQAEGPPFYLMMYTAARVFSGESPGEPLKDAVARISPTATTTTDRDRRQSSGGAGFQSDAEAAHEPIELWELPDVDHTAAIRERAEEYERRVVGFFDDVLLDGS